MSSRSVNIERLPIHFKPNSKRVINNIYNISEQTVNRIYNRMRAWPDEEIYRLSRELEESFFHRHRDLPGQLERVFDKIRAYLSDADQLSPAFRRLLSSYFINEYSIEGAALFNPSIVPHPDQSGLKADELRFLLSLRATGEGHISSVEFMSGVVSASGTLKLDAVSRFSTLPEKVDCSDPSNVHLYFNPHTALSERVIFPVSPEEKNGIEDVRLVILDDGSQKKYYGTFTAYDGRMIRPKLISTSDFINFDLLALHGRAVIDKGMALFPKKIGGRYTMISRQDSENILIMFSDDLFRWDESEIIKVPAEYWELAKIGNCGSPLETDDGWLLLTHGVGFMRKYSIGAILLDKDNPSRVIATLKEPLLSPDENEREGYVPNVLYTCGGLIHAGKLILPYAMSDAVAGFARADVSEIISCMEGN